MKGLLLGLVFALAGTVLMPMGLDVGADGRMALAGGSFIVALGWVLAAFGRFTPPHDSETRGSPRA